MLVTFNNYIYVNILLLLNAFRMNYDDIYICTYTYSLTY